MAVVVWDAKVFFGIRHYQNFLPVSLCSIKRNKEKKTKNTTLTKYKFHVTNI
jgi:hypothetical protein